VAWAAAFVAIWWLADWLSMRQEGEPLPLRRAPLRMLGDVLRRLARNRSFLVALAALWLLSAAIGAMVMYFAAELGVARPTGPATPVLARMGLAADAIPELLARELPEALPRLVEIPLGFWGGLLFAALLVLGLVRLMIDPPDEFGDEAARGLKWPVVLLCLHVAGSVALLATGQRFFREMTGLDPPWYTPWVLVGQGLVMAGVFLAPVHALVWRIVLEIVRDGVWSFKSSIRSVSASSLPAALLLLFTMPVVATAVGPGAMSKPPLYRLLDAVVIAIPILLIFAPWAVVDRGVGLIEALRESWRLFRHRPFEVVIFALRFALLFAVLGGIVALFEPAASARWHTWHGPLLGVVRNALTLLQAMTIAGLYVHLRDESAAAGSCAECSIVEPEPTDA